MSLLHQILQSTRSRVSSARAGADEKDLERRAAEHTVRGFRRRLVEVGQAGVAVIAELKKASPSKGLIRAEFDAGALACFRLFLLHSRHHALHTKTRVNTQVVHWDRLCQLLEEIS